MRPHGAQSKSRSPGPFGAGGGDRGLSPTAGHSPDPPPPPTHTHPLGRPTGTHRARVEGRRHFGGVWGCPRSPTVYKGQHGQGPGAGCDPRSPDTGRWDRRSPAPRVGAWGGDGDRLGVTQISRTPAPHPGDTCARWGRCCVGHSRPPQHPPEAPPRQRGQGGDNRTGSQGWKDRQKAMAETHGGTAPRPG